MINIAEVPVHPFAVGVTVMVAVTGDVVELVAVNEGMALNHLPQDQW
jgi:hypothetical protein